MTQKDIKSSVRYQLSPWQNFIYEYTSYQCGWWKGTSYEETVVTLKVLWVISLLYTIPRCLFKSIDVRYEREFISGILLEMQKGTGGG